jgi:hypothetical protein
MPRNLSTAILTTLIAAAIITADAIAAATNRIATMSVPGKTFDNFDIGYVDSAAGRYYVADRSNAAVDIFDTQTKTFIGRVEGFAGVRMDANGRVANNISGPNGVAFDAQKKQLWVGDGDSTVKVIDVATYPARIVASVNTGGQKRADELTVDSKDGIVLIGNNADKPSFVSFISTAADHRILAKIEMPDASNGIDQPAYVPETGLFYASVPIWKGQRNHGGLAVFDPKMLAFVRLIPIDDCVPAGTAHGPGTRMIVGCSAGSQARTPGIPAATVIADVATEKVVKVVHEIGGSDEVWFNPAAHRYYTASRDQPGGPVLGVIDADAERWIENVATGANAHSVAADRNTNMVFVPLMAPNSVCPKGCIGIYQAN